MLVPRGINHGPTVCVQAETRMLNHSGFNEAKNDGWQWYQLNHMQIICTSLQTDNHASDLNAGLYTKRLAMG